jgi:phage gp36-like protein
MYLTVEDLNAGGYMEELLAVGRTEQNMLSAIAEAMAEVQSYLSARYDIGAEFAKTGTARNPMVLKIARNIAIYNIYNIGNPSSVPESRIAVYRDDIAFLKNVQAEKASLPSLTRLTDPAQGGSSFIAFGGNKKRNNQW